MRSWSHVLRDLVGLADPTTIACLPIRSSVPIAPWQTQRITLLGDAIHSMTPYRGIGANVALKDAVRLKRALVAAHRGERDVVDALHEYEIGMRDYGFRAVRKVDVRRQRLSEVQERPRRARNLHRGEGIQVRRRVTTGSMSVWGRYGRNCLSI
jgi:2-polyprenyl-6-methoxyphenol hydroxylase-like FAD-dependent oxidoreductase